MKNKRKRVVVSGVGMVSSLGCGVENFEQAVNNGLSGIKKAKNIDIENSSISYSAEIEEYKLDKIFDSSKIRRANRFSLIALGATKYAFEDAKLPVPYQLPESIGLLLSTDFGPSQTVIDFMEDLFEYGSSGVSPSLFTQTVMNVAVGYIAINFQIKGISSLLQGGDGVLFAYKHISSGDVPLILVGGVDELTQLTFDSYALSGYLVEREEQFLPLDKNRKGTILGEGGGMLVLEDYEHAIEHHRNIYAEIVGIGISTDGINDLYITEKSDQGKGLQLAIERALKNAVIEKEEIGCIMSCANGSRELDITELRVLQSVFGNYLDQIWITCGKSYFGESFNASSFLNQILALLSIKKGVVYPTLHTKTPEINLRMSDEIVDQKIEYLLCNNIYSNGTNMSIIFKKIK